MTPKDIKKFIKKCNAQYANGSPFDTLRESEVEDLQKKGELFCFYADSGSTLWRAYGTLEELRAVVVARQLYRPLTVKDFAQRTYTIPAGTLYIKGLYTWELDSAHISHVLHIMRNRTNNQWLSVQVYAEHWLQVQALRNDLFERALTKVTAFAEVKTIYTNTNVSTPNNLDHVEDESLCVVRAKAIYHDVRHYILGLVDELLHTHPESFANHYSIYNKDAKWSGLTLRGYGNSKFIEKPTEMSRRWKADPANVELLDRECKDTEVAPYFRHALQIAYALFPAGTCFERIRILKLDAGGNILRHCDIQDKEAGLADGKIARFHVPLKTGNTVFSSWGVDGLRVRLRMPEGSLCYLDHRKPHAVTNYDDKERLHLVIDVYSTAAIREMISKGAKEHDGWQK